MTKLTPVQISNKFFLENNLAKEPTLDDLTRVFIIAAKKYINREIDSYSFSAISETIYSDFTHTVDIWSSDLGNIVEEATELNFYIGNLSICANPQTPDHQKALDHSIAVIRRTEDYIKRFLDRKVESNNNP
ncbi:MAG: hypothetical protein WA052_04025 [Microgenomates group bacterium]